MSLANGFVERMQAGRDAAAYRRHKGLSTGKAAPGHYQQPSARYAAMDAAYPDEESRADWSAAKWERIEAEWREIDELNAREIERFGCDLNGEIVPGGLPASGLATAATRTPVRTRGRKRQRGGNMPKEMDSKEFSRLVEKLWHSIYAAGQSGQLGLSYRQLRRMADGEQPIPLAIATLLRIMARDGIEPSDLP